MLVYKLLSVISEIFLSRIVHFSFNSLLCTQQQFIDKQHAHKELKYCLAKIHVHSPTILTRV